MSKETTLPDHIANLDPDDQAIWLAWQDCGGTEESTIDEAREALVGIYRNEKEAGEEIGRQYFDDFGTPLYDWLIIDWEATWECNLRHDFSSTTHDGQLYAFRA